MDGKFTIEDRQVDQLIEFCSRLVETHVTEEADRETILAGLELLRVRARRTPEQSSPTPADTLAMFANLRDQMDIMNRRLQELERRSMEHTV